jgi:hypothetical protein
MAVPFSYNTPQMLVNNVQTALTQLRNALQRLQNLEVNLSAYAQTDFQAAPMSMTSNDTGLIWPAVADGNALATIAFGGAVPTGYTLPYNFDTSWAKVIGPLT